MKTEYCNISECMEQIFCFSTPLHLLSILICGSLMDSTSPDYPNQITEPTWELQFEILAKRVNVKGNRTVCESCNPLETGYTLLVIYPVDGTRDS